MVKTDLIDTFKSRRDHVGFDAHLARKWTHLSELQQLVDEYFQEGPASQLVVDVMDWEDGHLLNWRKQTLPEGLGDGVLFQRWKGDGTWTDPGRTVDWFPKGTVLVYRAQGVKSPDIALLELFAPHASVPSHNNRGAKGFGRHGSSTAYRSPSPQASSSARPKKRARLPSPEVEIMSGMNVPLPRRYLLG
jgi:hypothetical protein